ncbi:MAG: flagellar biosynthesis protein FlhB [Pseudomonadota bacterium]
MPDKGAQDKTEKPTSRRRQKAREKGQVAKSAELASVAVLMGGLGALYLFGGYISHETMGLLRYTLGNAAQVRLDSAEMGNLSVTIWMFFFKVMAPVMIAVVAAALLSNLAQVGFVMSGERLMPDLKKINPLAGFKRWVSLRSLVDMVKNIAKLCVVGWVAYRTVAGEWNTLPTLGDTDLMASMVYLVGICFRIFWRCVLAMMVLALLDWAYQKYDYEKNLKMSKQEIKDEYKQSEGDPMVKSRIRSIQREATKKRMMSAVPQADVVITNPTHYAVALAYQPGDMEAPQVVAKGMNRVAQKIKQIAGEAGVPIIEDKVLAQSLYKQVEVGQSIPFDLYEAVATILAHVYRSKDRQEDVLQAQQARGAAR